MSVSVPALEFASVRHAYGEVVAVDDFSLAVQPGEVVCLLGPSGCGKTSLLRIAAGLETLQHGRVSIGGRVVGDTGIAVPPEQRSVGLVFQDYALFPHLTVAGNVAFGLPRDFPGRQQRVMEVLASVGLESCAGRYPHALSGGQQQRVALARALAPRPSVILLDEPFSGLDARLRDQVRDQTLHVLKQAGAATLLVTHDAEEAMFMADRIAVMRSGRLEQEGQPETLYCAPASAFVAEFFGEVNRLAGTAKDGWVETPLGRLRAASIPDGAAADILIRPEGLRLIPQHEAGSAAGRVLAARMLGRSSLVHLCMCRSVGQRLHLHARIPGRYLPQENAELGIVLDDSQAFVFPAAG
ncbi:MAG: ABC transporter ATP-binding protein [Alphaproteobacteria bacterium]